MLNDFNNNKKGKRMKVFGVKDITYSIADVDQKEVITKAILEKLAQDGIEFEGEGYFDIK